MIAEVGVEWLSLPTVTAVEVIVHRMLVNAEPDDGERPKPMTYSERVAWLCEIPDSQLTEEELQRKQDDELLAMFGMRRPNG